MLIKCAFVGQKTLIFIEMHGTTTTTKTNELYLIKFVWGDLNSKFPTPFNLGLYRSSVAESLGLCEAQIGRIDFVEATGSFKNRNF
jgi:hypothetical protein